MATHSSNTYSAVLGRFKQIWRGGLQYSWAYLVAQLVKNPLAMWETWVRSLGWEDPLEKRRATHSSILAWRIPWTKDRTWLSDFHFSLSQTLWDRGEVLISKKDRWTFSTLTKTQFVKQEIGLEYRIITWKIRRGPSTQHQISDWTVTVPGCTELTPRATTLPRSRVTPKESQKKEVLGQFPKKLATVGKLQMGWNPHFCPAIFCGLIVELPPYTRTNNSHVSAGRKASQVLRTQEGNSYSWERKDQ